VKKKKKMS
jgi:hypothetical protein